MYNLFVAYDIEAWNGQPMTLDLSRCVREYTESEIKERWGSLDKDAIAELIKLPCIFAYEDGQMPPKFGRIKEIRKRQNLVNIQYEIINVESFLTLEDFNSMAFELDITGWEMSRTHWAVKDVNLPKELQARGIIVPSWVPGLSKTVDITTHTFDVALSFSGEDRPAIELIAKELERGMGPDTYFYDNNYQAQLARPALDTLLQEIYSKRSKLIVVFLSANYQRKEWCGVEFRPIKEIIMTQDHKRIMFVRMDDGEVDGVFKTDGYIDGRIHSPQKIASFIEQRVHLI